MSKETSSGGIGLTGMLTVLFVGLKLMHYIDWSWWWVLSPLWLPLPVLFVVFFLILLVKAVVGES